MDTDLTQFQKPVADKLRVVVSTRSFSLEGFLHFPRLGKEGRRLSNLLNTDRRFMALTNVIVTDRITGAKNPKPYGLLQINMESVEFVQPYMDDKELASETD